MNIVDTTSYVRSRGGYSTLAEVSRLNSCYTNGSPAPPACPDPPVAPEPAGIGALNADPNNPLNCLPAATG
ncbi:hypothetical protein EBZ80_12580 [bacterium]|nr:hypothetical protein [bacterium]